MEAAPQCVAAAQRMSMSLVFDEAPPGRRGAMLGLRMTMVFGLHIIVPLISGLMGFAGKWSNPFAL